jgi:hypothetical protein
LSGFVVEEAAVEQVFLLVPSMFSIAAFIYYLSSLALSREHIFTSFAFNLGT